MFTQIHANKLLVQALLIEARRQAGNDEFGVAGVRTVLHQLVLTHASQR